MIVGSRKIFFSGVVNVEVLTSPYFSTPI